MLKLTLFGSQPTANVNGPIEIKSRKGLGLLAYLAESDESVSRDRLAGLFWPETDQERARGSLRRALYQLNQTSLKDHIIVQGEEIRLDGAGIRVDTRAFKEKQTKIQEHQHASLNNCDACLADLEEISQLYTGDFLAFFYMPDSSPFEDWASQVREHYRLRAAETFAKLTDLYLAQNKFNRAAAAARRGLEIDPFHEGATRALMNALANAGRRSEALSVFHTFESRLRDELQIEAGAATRAVFEAVREGQIEEKPIQPGDHTPGPELGSRTARSNSENFRARQVLCEKVKAFWVEGVLKNSLYRDVLIELGLAASPGSVEYPWGLVVERPGQEKYSLAPGVRVLDVFDECQGALLILGEPGAGKTTTLLELARATIDRAEQDPGAPTPVVFNLSSWNGEPFSEWLAIELNEKYLIPRRVGKKWAAGDELLLLLDGLDEVKPERRAACAAAINRYRQEHGLVRLAVCSRTAEYEALPDKLRLETAVAIQPLTEGQVDEYLAGFGPELEGIQASLREDKGLAELVASPLMLSILILAFQGMEIPAARGDEALAAQRAQIFETYIERMFARRKGKLHFERANTVKWLSWLAEKMKTQGESIFLLERLQPAWLDSRPLQIAYLFAARTAAVLSLYMLPKLIMEGLRDIFVSPSPGVFGDFYPYLFGRLLTIGIFAGGLFSLFAWFVFRYEQPKAALSAIQGNRWFRRTAGLTAIFILLVLGNIIVNLIDGYPDQELYTRKVLVRDFMEEITPMTAIVIGLLISGRTLFSEIRPTETLKWSWRTAFAGGLIGAIGLVAIFSFDTYAMQIILLPWIDVVGLSIIGFFIGFLPFGFVPGVNPIKTRPNLGIRLSLISGLRYGLLLPSLLVPVLFIALFVTTLDPAFGGGVSPDLIPPGFQSQMIRVVFLFSIAVFLWLGGIEVLHHFILRSFFWIHGSFPLRAISFLDEASHILLLKKVGGGYIFTHPLLADHFAAKRLIVDETMPTHQAEARNSRRVRWGIIGLALAGLWGGLFLASQPYRLKYLQPADPFLGQEKIQVAGIDCAPIQWQGGGEPLTSLTFLNNTDREVLVYWVNFTGTSIREGEEWLWGILPPHDTHQLPRTFDRHLFCLRDAETGESVLSYLTTGRSPEVVMIEP